MNILITNFHLKDGGGHKTYIKSILKKSLQIQNRFFLATPKNSSLYLDQLENKENILFDIEFPSKPREISKSQIQVSNCWRWSSNEEYQKSSCRS